jgi:Fe-S cluster assembly iron-binding protein IscA
MIGFTDRAIEIIARSDAAARRFNPDARVRLSADGGGVRFELVDVPAPTDEIVERDGFTIFVAEGLEGTVDVVEPHDRLILRSGGLPTAG